MIRNREQENLNLNHRLCWIILMTHLMLLKCKLKPWGGATVIQNSNTLEESCLQLSALDWLWYCKTIHFNLEHFQFHKIRTGLKRTDCCHTDDLTYLIWQPLPPYVMDEQGKRSERSMIYSSLLMVKMLLWKALGQCGVRADGHWWKKLHSSWLCSSGEF